MGPYGIRINRELASNTEVELEIVGLEQQLAPHLQRLDRLREQRLQALQEYAASKRPPEPGPTPSNYLRGEDP